MEKISIDLSRMAQASDKTMEMVQELESGIRKDGRFLASGVKLAPKWGKRFLNPAPKTAPKRNQSEEVDEEDHTHRSA